MRNVLRSTVWIAFTAVACALVVVAAADATRTRSSHVFTLAQIRGVVAKYHPNAQLPTRLPPKVSSVDIGFICPSPGTGAPPCFALLDYFAPGASAEPFQLFLYDGRVANKVVAALVAHDGGAWPVTAFTAGRFVGKRERQWTKKFKVGGFDTYVWQDKLTTYALSVHFLDSGAPAYPGTVPRTVIASFSPIKAAKPPAPAMVVMPDVIGLQPLEAILATRKAGLTGPWIRAFTPALTPDQVHLVLKTSPVAGTRMLKNATITLYLGM